MDLNIRVCHTNLSVLLNTALFTGLIRIYATYTTPIKDLNNPLKIISIGFIVKQTNAIKSIILKR